MDNRTPHISGQSSRLPRSRSPQRPLVEEFPDLAPGLVMSTFRTRPVWAGMAWRRAFAGRGDQSAPARRMVGRLLADTGRGEDAEWVSAELVSNALRHSRSGQDRGFFVVEVLRGADVARIVVYDLGGGSVPDFSLTPGSLPGLAEHGRGLAGVAELAIRFGAAGDASTGHAVWVDLAVTEEALRTAAAGDAVGREPESTHSYELVPVPLAGKPGADGDERAVGLAPSAGSPGTVLRQGMARVSAFGQEEWAQQALAGLRRDWPDWAFLVVRYRWLAMRGKQVVMSGICPEELRRALPPIPVKPIPAGSGSATFVVLEHEEAEPGRPLPTLSDLSGVSRVDSHEGWASPGMSPRPASVSGVDVGGVRGCDGAGAGLSGTLTAVASPSGVLAAERSGTGTWAVAVAGPARVVGWPRWWTWGRRWGRSPGESGGHQMGRDRPLVRGEPRHRRVESKPIAVAAVAA